MEKKTHRIKPAPKPAVAVQSAPMRHRPRESVVAMTSGEFEIAAFTIRVSNKQHYRLYSIYTKVGNVLIGRQASYPSIYDCLEKLERAYAAGDVSDARYHTILQSRAVAQELDARSAA